MEKFFAPIVRLYCAHNAPIMRMYCALNRTIK